MHKKIDQVLDEQSPVVQKLIFSTLKRSKASILTRTFLDVTMKQIVAESLKVLHPDIPEVQYFMISGNIPNVSNVSLDWDSVFNMAPLIAKKQRTIQSRIFHFLGLDLLVINTMLGVNITKEIPKESAETLGYAMLIASVIHHSTTTEDL
jgi:hypothetical protein